MKIKKIIVQSIIVIVMILLIPSKLYAVEVSHFFGMSASQLRLYLGYPCADVPEGWNACAVHNQSSSWLYTITAIYRAYWDSKSKMFKMESASYSGIMSTSGEDINKVIAAGNTPRIWYSKKGCSGGNIGGVWAALSDVISNRTCCKV